MKFHHISSRVDVDEFSFIPELSLLNTLPDYVTKAPTFDLLNCHIKLYNTIHCIILVQVRLYICK